MYVGVFGDVISKPRGRAHVQYATILLLVFLREGIVYVGVGGFVNC